MLLLALTGVSGCSSVASPTTAPSAEAVLTATGTALAFATTPATTSPLTPATAPTRSGPILVGPAITSANADAIIEVGRVDLGAEGLRLKNLGWAPDSQTLAVVTSESVRIYAVPDLDLIMDLRRGEDWYDLNLTAASFRHDGSELAIGGVGFVQRWDWRTGLPVAPERQGIYTLDMEYSPEGDWLAIGSRDGLVVLPGDGDGQSRTLDNDRMTLLSRPIAFSPDGAILIEGPEDGLLRAWRVGNWSLAWEQTIDGVLGWSDLAASPDGRFLAAGRGGTGFDLFDPQSGSIAATLRTDRDLAVTSLAFSPDGSLLVLATLDGEISSWNLDTLGRTAEYVAVDGGIHHASFSPDGRMLAFSTSDGAIRIWAVPPEN